MFPCVIWCFCGISCYVSFSISYFTYLDSLSLLGEPGRRFASLVYPFNEPALGFIHFLKLFLKSLFPLCPLSCSFLITNATDAVNLILNITQRIVYF